MTVGKIPSNGAPIPQEPERPVAQVRNENRTAAKPLPKPAAATPTAPLSSLQNNTSVARPQNQIKHASSELASQSEQLQHMRDMQQTRSEVSQINQTLQQARRELQDLSQERLGAFMTSQPLAGSYWDRLDLVEKAQTINRLKEQVRSLEVERADLVQSLREQVMNGTYAASGGEILQGMMEEFL